MKKPLKQSESDLDYLAGLGYGLFPPGESEIRDLRSAVRSKAAPSYFGFICLLTGVFLGLSLTMALPDVSAALTPKEQAAAPGADTGTVKPAVMPLVHLDTLELLAEKYLKATQRERLALDDTDAVSKESAETLEPVRYFTSGSEAELLRTGGPGPVLYIHDLKVSEYRRLYFRFNGDEPVPVKGTPASLGNQPDDANILSDVPRLYLHQLLSEALWSFRKQDYPRALFLFSQLLALNPEDVNARFYMGMAHYYRGHFQQARAFLSAIEGSSINAFEEEARFYYALSMLQLGENEEAEKMLKEIRDEKGFYAAQSVNWLEKIEAGSR